VGSIFLSNGLTKDVGILELEHHIGRSTR
jgi:hypothetical protein